METDINPLHVKSGVTLGDKDERARRAVKAFRAMQPTLTAYARILTKRSDVRVEMAARDNGSTDGKRIFFRPPLALGDMTPHVKSLCDRRDDEMQLRCPACKIREGVMVTILHEIAHICYDSFAPPEERDLVQMVERAVVEHGSIYAQKLKQRLEATPSYKKRSFKDLASLVSPFLPILVNALEDARVNSAQFKARKGTKVMFEAHTKEIFRSGVEQVDPATGETVTLIWNTYPLNLQVIIGLFCKASGYEYKDFFVDQVVQTLDDDELTKLTNQMHTVRNAAGVYHLSFPILARLRELGYCKSDMDPEPEPEEQPEEPQSEEQGDDEGDGASSDDDDAAELSEAGGSGSPDEGDGGSGDEGSERDGEADSPPSSDGDSDESDVPASDDGDGDSAGGSEQDQQSDTAGSDGEEASEEAGSDQSDDSGSEGQDDSGAGLGEEADEEGAGGGDDQSEPDGSDGTGASGDGDASGGESSEPAGEGADPTGTTESDSGDDGDADGEPDAGDGTGDGSSGASGSSGGALDGDEDASSEGAGGSAGQGGSDDSGVDSSREGDGEGEGDDSAPDPSGMGGQGDSPTEQATPSADAGTEGETDERPDAGQDSDSPDEADAAEPGSTKSDGAEEERDSDADARTRGDSTDDGSSPDEPARPEGDVPDLQSDDESESSGDDGRPDEVGAGDESEPIDTGADDGQGGVELVEDPKNDDIPLGEPDEVNLGVLRWMEHDEKPKSIQEQEADDAKAVDVAIIQGLYFETPSKNITGVREWRYGEDELDAHGDSMALAWNHKTYIKWGYDRKELGIEGDFDTPESILGPALLRARVAFSENQRGKDLRHLKGGKVDPNVLGRRAFHGDDRLFKRRVTPGKRNYFVCIGVDVSGSTIGRNIVLEKMAVMAQARLLARMGIKFAIYAHTGNYTDPSEGRKAGLSLDMYLVKEPDEPWTPKVEERLRELGPASVNLDGHTLEYYRKVLDKVQATDKIILYYTDGKMPAENHDEELEILQREIKTCKRKGYTLLGVGIRTDSPIKHGLDTVQVDDVGDIVKVVKHLEKRLLQR